MVDADVDPEPQTYHVVFNMAFACTLPLRIPSVGEVAGAESGKYLPRSSDGDEERQRLPTTGIRSLRNNPDFQHA
jgi:hypothetical protein